MRKNKLFSRPKGDRDMAEQERILRGQMRNLKEQMEQAQIRFDLACDDELVESCIFEINALSARYRFLLRQAKQLRLRQTKETVSV